MFGGRRFLSCWQGATCVPFLSEKVLVLKRLVSFIAPLLHLSIKTPDVDSIAFSAIKVKGIHNIKSILCLRVLTPVNSKLADSEACYKIRNNRYSFIDRPHFTGIWLWKNCSGAHWESLIYTPWSPSNYRSSSPWVRTGLSVGQRQQLGSDTWPVGAVKVPKSPISQAQIKGMSVRVMFNQTFINYFLFLQPSREVEARPSFLG